MLIIEHKLDENTKKPHIYAVVYILQNSYLITGITYCLLNSLGAKMYNENLVYSTDNPIPELINDDIYGLLISRGLINEKSVRDYLIKKRFKNMRDSKVRASEAIDTLREEYPYLQFDTIRKIVYQS